MTEATVSTKKETVIESVTMNDGRIVDFPGKKILQKDSFIAPSGEVSVRLDFRNGETRTFKIRNDMLTKFAAHGAEQKLGDEIAGVKKADGTEADIDDKVLVIDDLIERLNGGEWTTKRDSNGMAGTSVLLRAIVEVKGLSVDKVKAFLATKTQAQKIAIRDSEKFRDVVARIEAEKAKAKPKVDIVADGTMAELEALPVE